MDAALVCEVLSEGQSGICVEFNVVGAAAVALIGSSAACGRSGRVLIVGHCVIVLVGIIKKVWKIGQSVCRVRVCCGGVFVRNYIFCIRRCGCTRLVCFALRWTVRRLMSLTVDCGFSRVCVRVARCSRTVGC